MSVETLARIEALERRHARGERLTDDEITWVLRIARYWALEWPTYHGPFGE